LDAEDDADTQSKSYENQKKETEDLSYSFSLHREFKIKSKG
jgi:hypothetical protein